MKKVLIIMLAILMLGGCTKKEEPEITTDPEVVVGGWTINADLPEMNDMIFDQARQNADAKLSPLFLLGSQVVAGTNYAYLCYDKTEEGKPSLKIVKVFNNLENGSKEITSIEDFNVNDYLDGEGETTPEGMMGGWQDNAEFPNMLSEEENNIFNKGFEGLVGVGYNPVAVLASQVVAGTNYVFLATGSAVVAEPVTHLYVVKMYADLSGNVELSNICGINLAK